MLVSDSFLAWSDGTSELDMAIWRADHGLARIQPVILEECAWRDAPYGDRSALPSAARAVDGWDTAAEAWDDVVGGLLEEVFELRYDHQSVGTTTARMLSLQIQEALSERERHFAGLNPLSTIELHLDVPFHRFDDRRWRRTTRALRLAAEDVTMRVRRLRRGEGHVILDLAARPEGLVRLAEIRGKGELEPLLGTRVLAMEYLTTDVVPVAAGSETPVAPYPTVTGDLPVDMLARGPLPSMGPSPVAPTSVSVEAVTATGPILVDTDTEGWTEAFAPYPPMPSDDEATFTEMFAAVPARELGATADLRPLRPWTIPLAVLVVGAVVGLTGGLAAWWTWSQAESPTVEEPSVVAAPETATAPPVQSLPPLVDAQAAKTAAAEPVPPVAKPEPAPPVAKPAPPVAKVEPPVAKPAPAPMPAAAPVPDPTPALVERSVQARWGGGDAAIAAGDGDAYADALAEYLDEIGKRRTGGRRAMHTAALHSFQRARGSITFEFSIIPAPPRLDFFGDAARTNFFTFGKGVVYGAVDLRVNLMARRRGSALVEIRAVTGPARPATGWVDAALIEP